MRNFFIAAATATLLSGCNLEASKLISSRFDAQWNERLKSLDISSLYICEGENGDSFFKLSSAESTVFMHESKWCAFEDNNFVIMNVSAKEFKYLSGTNINLVNGHYEVSLNPELKKEFTPSEVVSFLSSISNRYEKSKKLLLEKQNNKQAIKDAWGQESD